MKSFKMITSSNLKMEHNTNLFKIFTVTKVKNPVNNFPEFSIWANMISPAVVPITVDSPDFIYYTVMPTDKKYNHSTYSQTTTLPKQTFGDTAIILSKRTRTATIPWEFKKPNTIKGFIIYKGFQG